MTMTQEKLLEAIKDISCPILEVDAGNGFVRYYFVIQENLYQGADKPRRLGDTWLFNPDTYAMWSWKTCWNGLDLENKLLRVGKKNGPIMYKNTATTSQVINGSIRYCSTYSGYAMFFKHPTELYALDLSTFTYRPLGAVSATGMNCRIQMLFAEVCDCTAPLAMEPITIGSTEAIPDSPLIAEGVGVGGLWVPGE